MPDHPAPYTIQFKMEDDNREGFWDHAVVDITWLSPNSKCMCVVIVTVAMVIVVWVYTCRCLIELLIINNVYIVLTQQFTV